MTRLFCLMVLGWFAHETALAQNLIPNPSFEAGTNQPAAWELTSGTGQWEAFGRTGDRCVSLTAMGDGGPYWRTASGCAIAPNQTYVLRYWGMTTNATGMGVVGQLEGLGGQKVILCDDWSPYALVLVTPTNALTPRFSLVRNPGVTGTQYFDDVQVTPAVPVHSRVGGMELGVGESFHTNHYLVQTLPTEYSIVISRLTELWGNYSRCLYQHTAVVDGDEWSGMFWKLSGSAFVTYRHGLDGLSLTNARVKATVTYGHGGAFVVDASTNGVTWQEVGRITPGFSALALFETNVPAGLFPAREVFVRLRTTGTLDVSNYEFEGEYPVNLPTTDGNTWFFEQDVPGDTAKPLALANTPTGHVFTVALRNTNSAPSDMSITCRTEGPAGTRERQLSVTVPALATNEVDLPLPSAGTGNNMARVEIKDQGRDIILLSGAMQLTVAAIRDDSYGASLPAPAGCSVWWCGSTYKVGRERAVPTATNSAVQIFAARNEYEPFQLVLRPDTTLTNVSVSVSDFAVTQPPGSAVISATNIEVALVEYVNVTRPTDASGTTGEHPDPVVPLSEPVEVKGQVNQPLWFTVFVPKDVPGGDYEATVSIQSPAYAATVPLRLHVFDFSLPDVTHTTTAYHADINSVWHHLTNGAQRQSVWDLYLQNFRRHRISPYAPHLYAPVDWSLTSGTFGFSFSAFDTAMSRYLDEFHFNGFNILGLKAPPFPNKLDGYSQFSSEYCENLNGLLEPIMAHLRERGWADRAYCFWSDEPQLSAYPFVSAGMKAIQTAAPGLRRALTVFPDPELYKDVDLWIPLLSSFRYFENEARLRERLAAGDSSSWYVCINPLAPRPNNFIDHPAINHRIRNWLAQRYGVTSEFYWHTTWYKSDNNTERNPWDDPMSVQGTSVWNGDGMLLYPPSKTPPTGPLIAGPVNSLRWELLREGLEDGEYFWLLREVLTKAELRLGPEHPAVLAGRAAQNEIRVRAPSVSSFERDPERLQLARKAIAEAIEALDDGGPLIVDQPRSRAVSTGEMAVLQVEALGWPLPTYQWRLNDTNLPGATDARLTLTNCGPLQAGYYSVVASNASGTATSAVAQIEGRWSETPCIIANPVDLVRPVGETAIFTVTAVAARPLSYLWLRGETPVTGAVATKPTLLLTNLTANQAGDYRVVISNDLSGAVTSAVARLTVLLPPSTNTLVFNGAAWKYHDLGVDLGTAWRQSDYDDSGWSNGWAQFGYGDGNEGTVVGLGQSPTTVYFRHAFTVSEGMCPAVLMGWLLRDDGGVVYLNGTEVFRNNLPTGTVSYATSAVGLVDGSDEMNFVPFSLPRDLCQAGTNVIAVEVHQNINDTPEFRQPVAYWSFDNAGSLGEDNLGTNSFSILGTNIFAQPGKFGGCVSNRYSVSGCLVAADSPELSYSGPFTVGGWFAFDYTTGGDPAITCLEKAGEFRLYYTGPATNRYRFEVNGTFVQDPTCCTTAGQWRFVVGWYDGTNVNIQVNNGSVYSTNATPPSDTTNPVVALKKVLSNGGMAADEVFLYKRVLSAAERTALYQNLADTNLSDLSFDFALTGTWAQLPQILSFPADLARRVGDNAAFTVNAVSATPLAYQWYFDGAPLAGATSILLFLGGVSSNHIGQYSVTVSNLAGTVTTPPATLNVIGTPEIHARLSAGGSGCTLEIPGYGVPGAVLVSTNLIDWSELLRFPPSLNPTNIMDSGASNAPSRFYRLRLDL